MSAGGRYVCLWVSNVGVCMGVWVRGDVMWVHIVGVKVRDVGMCGNQGT